MTNEQIRETLKTQEYNFLRTNRHLGNRIMYMTLGGSHSYGTNVEDSDLDLRGITAERPEELIGMENFDVFDLHSDTTDAVFYGFNKVFGLLAKCNPNVIEMLGTDEADIFYMSPAGKLIRDNAGLFLSKEAENSFVGYANGQMTRMKNFLMRENDKDDEVMKYMVENLDHRLRIFSDRFEPLTSEQVKLYIGESPKKNTDKEILVDVSLTGYPLVDFQGMQDELRTILQTYKTINARNKKKDNLHLNKHAMHLLRLYIIATDIFEKERIITKRTAERDFLLSVRNGRFQNPDGSYMPEFFECVDEYKKRLEYAIANTSLPERPDFKKLQDLKMTVNKMILSDNF